MATRELILEEDEVVSYYPSSYDRNLGQNLQVAGAKAFLSNYNHCKNDDYNQTTDLIYFT